MYRAGFWLIDRALALDPHDAAGCWLPLEDIVEQHEALTEDAASARHITAESFKKSCSDFMDENGGNMEAAIATLHGKPTALTPHD